MWVHWILDVIRSYHHYASKYKNHFNRPVDSKDKTNPILAKILPRASHLWGGFCCCILSVVCVMFTLTQLKEANGRTMQWLVNWARFFSRSPMRFVSTLADKNKLSNNIPTCVASLYLVKVDKEAQTNLIESTCWCLLECQQSKWLLDLKLECFSFTIHKGHCNSAAGQTWLATCAPMDTSRAEDGSPPSEIRGKPNETIKTSFSDLNHLSVILNSVIGTVLYALVMMIVSFFRSDMEDKNHTVCLQQSMWADKS